MLFLYSIILSIISYLGYSQVYEGNNASLIIPGCSKVWIQQNSSIPAFIEFKPQNQIIVSDFKNWVSETFNLDKRYDFILIDTSTDEIGYTHYKYREYYSGYPIEKAIYIIHAINGKISSMNGLLFDKINVDLNYTLQESQALNNALKSIHADL